MKRVEPIRDMVLIRLQKQEETRTAGGIFVPQTAKRKCQLAEVLAVGPGKLTDQGQLLPVNVAAGDVVIVQDYNMQQKALPTGDGDDELYLVPDCDIAGKVHES